MVKVERSLPAPASLAMEKEKTNGSYNGSDVVKRLMEEPTFLVTMASQMDGTKTEQIGITALTVLRPLAGNSLTALGIISTQPPMVRCPLGI